MRIAVISALFLALAACTPSDTGPRVINIADGPTPASATLSSSLEGLISRTSDSYVTLVVHNSSLHHLASQERMSEAITSGSGFVIDSAGHVITAGHVAVRDGWLVQARGPDGRVYQGKVVATQNSPDIALLRLNGLTSAKPVSPAPSACLSERQPVFSLGKPRSFGDTARVGELASMSFGQEVRYGDFGYPDAIVLNIATRRGESGGPVFDTDGRLVAMVVSTLSDSAGRHLNMAHALPLPMLAEFICRNTNCSSAWRAHASASLAQCL